MILSRRKEISVGEDMEKVENIMEIPQEIENVITINLTILLLSSISPRKAKSVSQKISAFPPSL